MDANFILRIFDAAYMQRWNDKLRPTEFYELDKQAHKMMIAYIINSFEENHQSLFLEIIKGGLFEFLQRMVLTDIKPPVFYKIKEHKGNYMRLNQYVISVIGDQLEHIEKGMSDSFIEYFTNESDTKAKRILRAAHVLASLKEFEIIKKFNPNSYDTKIIEQDLKDSFEQYRDLEGVSALVKSKELNEFVQICHDLRYQARWAHTHRIPKTSVLGHSLYVAIITSFFTIKLEGRGLRLYNNFVGALFHDLPEALTRDIISPIKRSVEGLKDIIKEYEDIQMNKVIYPMMSKKMKDEIKCLLDYEFDTILIKNNEIYKSNSYELNILQKEADINAYDGQIVRACDELSAFIEAKTAMNNGCNSCEFEKATQYILDKYHKNGVIGGIHFDTIIERLNKYNEIK